MGWLILLIAVTCLRAQDPQHEGIKALEEKRYQEAAAAFEKAVAADPKDYGAQFHLALAQSLLGLNDQAIASYRKVLELKPDLYEAELNLGILLLEKRDHAAAVGLLRSASAKKPDQPRPRLYLGEAHLAAGEFQQAKESFEAAVALNPNSAAAEAGLGQALLRSKLLEEAEVHLKKAALLDPAYKSLLLELASAYEQSKQPGKALSLYEGFSGDAAVQERTGILLLESGRHEEAEARLEAAVKSSPTSANRYALATVYLRTKQLGKASAMLELAVADEPRNLDLRMAYGRCLRDQRRFCAAAQQFIQVVQAKSDHREAWSELASALLLNENFPQALAAFDRLEALGENGPALHYFRAITLDRLKQVKPALDSYTKFLGMSEGKFPDEEFKARQRARILQKELDRR